MSTLGANIPQPVTKTEGFNYAALIARLLVAIFLAASLGVIWWSYYREFFPYVKQSRELTATAAKLDADLADLNQRWTAAQIQQINQNSKSVQTNLFADQAELQTWLAGLREESFPLGLEVKSEFAPALRQTDAEPAFLILPTTVSVKIQPLHGSAKSHSPYQRLLHLTQSMATHEKADCLEELTVETGPNSIDHAVMGFNFWAGTNAFK